MTVYKKETLKNLYIRQQAKEAAREKLISAEMLQGIYSAHPVDLFMPNVFVRIGLGVLTLFITLCSVGLIALVTDFTGGLGAFLLLMSVVCYVFLEIMTGAKRHYNSGVDNLLQAATVGFVAGGILFFYSEGSAEIVTSFILTILCTWLAIRFADRVMAVVAAISFLTLLFNSYAALGEFTIGSFPFVLIIASAVMYYFSNKMATTSGYSVYRPVWQVVSVVGLLAFYLGGNFYVVAGISDSSYLLQKNSALSFSWFFWFWTMAVPVAILVTGVKRKNVLLLRAGILLSVVAVLTIRYYYHVLSSEAAMLTAGVVLIGGSYFLMRYLRTPKGGFVFDSNTKEESDDFAAFAIDQALSRNRQSHAKTKFEGGDFGGGGAGSSY